MNTRVSVIIPVYNVEKYIGNMLKSVRNQTFTDFEVIIINDGSSDDSQQIIDRLCGEDKRFRTFMQENSGVASARNRGLELATGDYVVFYDPDDYIPENAIADMYYTAKAEYADLIIGIMQIESTGSEYKAGASKRLARKKSIEKFDKDLNWNFSVCNKMFKREVIDKNNLRFPDLKHGEDGVFLFSYIQKCNIITGCNNVVYRYFRREPWESKSATQNRAKKTVVDLLNCFELINEITENTYEQSTNDTIMKAGKNSMDVEELECRYKEYKSDLYSRFVHLSLLGEYYRFIWTLDSETIDLIEAEVFKYKNKIFPSDWNNLVLRKNEDLQLNSGMLLRPEEITESPALSFVISSGPSECRISDIISCIYNQNFPSFEVLVDNSWKGKVSNIWEEKINFHYIPGNSNTSIFKQSAMKLIRGQFAYYIDEDVFISRRLIKQMYDIAVNKNNTQIPVFVSVPMVHMAEDDYYVIFPHQAVFINELTVRKIRSPYNQLDCIWGNKLFSVARLKAKKVVFEGNSWKDMNRLYNNSGYIKAPRLRLATLLDTADFLKPVRNIRVKLLYKFKLKQEESRIRRVESYNERIVTLRQKLKNWKLKNIRSAYRYLTRKVIFPVYYKICAMRAVDDSKAVFVEPRLESLTNSMTLIRDKLAEDKSYKIHEHFLRQNFSRYRQEFKRSMRFVKDMATARFVFLAEANEIIGCLKKRKETIIVQTWHGCGAFKKFGFSTAGMIFGDNLKKKNRYPAYKNYDIVTVSSPEVIWAYKEAMSLEDDSVIMPLGVSRTDVFYDSEYINNARKHIEKFVPQIKDKKVILYAPTFRGRVASATTPDKLDIALMARELSDEYVLLIKHHPLVRTLPEIPAEYRDSFAFDLTRTASIEDLICIGDICISDYSSLVFEYSLFERPMIFFAYDLDIYFDWRGFYYDYDELTPGPVVSRTEEIVDYIRSIDTVFDKERVIKFKNKFMSACDGHSTDRILDKIKTIQ